MSNSTAPPDLRELTERCQAACDDASMDHAYCGQNPGPSHGGLGAHIAEGENLADRLSALSFAIETRVKVHRANGGKGRGMVRFQRSATGVEGFYRFVTSPSDVFDFLREDSHEHA